MRWNSQLLLSNARLRLVAAGTAFSSMSIRGHTVTTVASTSATKVWTVAMATGGRTVRWVAVGVQGATAWLISYKGAVLAAAVATKAWTVTLLANPVVRIVAVVLALVAALGLLATQWDRVKSSFGTGSGGSFSGPGGGFGGGNGSPAIRPLPGRDAVSRYYNNSRENITINNTYNMQGVTNLEEAARYLSERQSQDVTFQVAGRTNRFALAGGGVKRDRCRKPHIRLDRQLRCGSEWCQTPIEADRGLYGACRGLC